MSALEKLVAWPQVRQGDRRSLALWDEASLVAATGGRASAKFQVSGAEIDSRDVQTGDLFFALKGENTDGHRFLDMAFENGAAAAVVDRPIDYPHVLVEDTTAALGAIAKASRERVDATIVGVTGSVGKTGVKEAIFAALERSSRGHAHRSVKSYNNHVGVPLSLARMGARSKFGVFELGMNHAGEISALTAQVRPHVAVITTIAPAHIEMLGSEEAIAGAKAEIFEGLREGGTAVIPADSPHFSLLRKAAEAAGAQIAAFGRSPEADIRLLDTVTAANGGSLVTAQLGRQRLCYTVAEPGEHWIANSLAVLAAVQAAGGDLGSAGLTLAEMDGLKGRGARHRIAVPGGHAMFIDESYNANPASMRATLAQLGATLATRRIAVLGSMKELGDFTPAFHAQLAEPILAAQIDHAILVGEEMTALANELSKHAGGPLGGGPEFAHCADTASAIAAIEELGLLGGDAVLVKGSNSIGLAKLVEYFTAREG